jgi:hypothetical protein
LKKILFVNKIGCAFLKRRNERRIKDAYYWSIVVCKLYANGNQKAPTKFLVSALLSGVGPTGLEPVTP